MKKMIDLFWFAWCNLTGAFILMFLICMFIFGGWFEFSINWRSFMDLYNKLRK